MTKTFEKFEYELEDLIDEVLDDDISDNTFDEKKYKFIKKYAPQPLPEVPEFVAEYIEECKKNKYALNLALDLMAKEYTSRKTELSTWIMSNQEQFAKAYFDKYTVQKPKRFYLKNKITGNVLVYDESTELSEVSELFATGGEFELENYTFTQQEIDKMEDTGSYEKIEVEE